MGDLMKDYNKTKKQLVYELTELHSQNAALKKLMTGSISTELAVEEARRYADNIVETVREPLLILDAGLKIISANRNFYKTFKVTPGETIGSFIYDLGKKQWDIPKLRELLEEVLPEKEAFDDFEVAHNFQDIGHKIMLLNAHRIIQKETGSQMIFLAIEDITERSQLKSLLEVNEEKYRELVQNANSIILKMDPEGNVTFFNEFAQMFFGYTEEEMLGRNVVGTIMPETGASGFDPEIMIKDIGINPKKYITNENENMRRNGERVWVAWTNKAIRDGNGEVKEILCIGNDITERKRLEDLLTESEERYRRLFETASDAIVLLEKREGKITHANPATEKMLGYTKNESIGNKLQNIGVLLDRGDFQTTMQTLNMSGIINYDDVPVITKSGQHIDTDIYLVDRARLVQCNIRDITERKRANKELQESEARYKMLFASAAEGILVAELKTKQFRYANPALCRMFGYTEEEILQLRVSDIHPKESLEQVLAEFEAQARSEKTLAPNLPCLRKDGAIFYANINTTSTFLDGKKCNVGFFTDITDRKKAEEEKQSLEERLQRAEKMEALGTLAGGVAHDLNNVLGVIIGYSELLLHGMDESNPIRQNLLKIMKGSERSAAIVQDLLTLARRGITGRQVLNLNKIILDYQNSPEFEKLFSCNSFVQIKLDLESDLLNISGSSVHLGKALFNLVLNAVEAMPKGGDLTVKTTNRYLDKPIYGYDNIREGDYVVLNVTDTGEGIKPADLQRIFEPFYTKKVMGRSGTGLGLAVVWGTVKDHQGYINVQSEEGKGSTFTIYFPVTREQISVEAAAVSVSEYMGKGETILVVDDVREQHELAAEILTKLNYKIASVRSGEDAVAYLKKHKVDLLVLDMIMEPGMDGLDTYKNILTIHPKQKAIIVSGFSESDRVNAAQSLGAGAYLEKPYILEKLGLAVRKELDKI